jgi:predicted dehydrogenase
LWQGPAPRKDYKDNIVHYNWHWFWHWGTGESCNNGTHEIDCCRWFLGVDYPTKVTSSGGRYAFKDDWQTTDTQVASFEFGNDKSITGREEVVIITR